MILSLGPKRSVEKKYFKKKLFSRWQKFLAHFCPYHRVWQTSRNNLWGSTSLFNSYSETYNSFSSGPKRFLKTQTLDKTPIFPVKWILLASFFSYYLTWQTSLNKLQGHTRCFDKYCVSHRINCLGPKKSGNKFFKDRLSSRWQLIWPIFFRIIEGDTDQRTICKGPTGIVTNTVEVIRSGL